MRNMKEAHIASGKRYEEIKLFRETHKEIYLNTIARLMGYTTIEEVFNDGWPVSELEKYSDEASKIVWGDLIPKTNWRFPCRELANELLTTLYGSSKAYSKMPNTVNRKVKKMGDTMEATYGYRNPGQSPEHKEAMRKGSNCKNPFSSAEFKFRSYVRGKTCKPGDEEKFKNYCKEVERLTEFNRELVPFDGKCYYTGIPIFRYDGNKKVNRNDYNMATLDHKISVLGGFMRGLSPEIISSIDNLCWCSKYFNSFKESKCEDEIRLSGMIERFNEVLEELNNESN